MQNQKQKNVQSQNSFFTFKSLFYPKFQPKQSAQIFLSKYDLLFQQLHKIDVIPQQQLLKIKIPLKYLQEQDQQINENQIIIYFIIQELNNLYSQCHRKQLTIRINQQLFKFNGNLKDLAIGKKQIKLSFWQQNFYKNMDLKDLDNQIQTNIIEIFDKLYLQYQRIPHYYLLFLQKPQALINLYKFQSKLILNEQSVKTSIPISHKYFLGVIAASTFGSRYLWNFTVKQFIKAGGDLNWVIQGMQEIPKYIKKFSEISYQMAFNFKVNIIQGICYQLGTLVEDTAILQGIYILCYYQFLACVSLVFGLIPESTEYQVYLPKLPRIDPSNDSFESMKQVSKQQQIYEKQIAKQFQQMYSWDKQKKIQSIKRIDLLKIQINSLKNKIQNQSRNNRDLKQNTLLIVSIQQENIINKIKNSRTMKNIQNIYEKYVPFNNRLSSFQYKRQKKTKNNQSQKAQFESNQQQNLFVYASEWNFEQHTQNMMDFVMGSCFYSDTNNLLNSLRFMDKKKSKHMKIYYQSLHNYMYEYISYLSLINESLSLIEKNYIKLLTRSPFLFNVDSFKRMKQDIISECQINQIVYFCMQMFSFKLQHSLSLASYVYHEYFDNID